MMTDSFWAFIALVIFLIILIIAKVPAFIKQHLDARACRIRNELEEARRLREEAQLLLAEYQRKNSMAESEAEHIIALAQREAKLIITDTKKKTEEYIQRRNKMAKQRIERAEREAIDFVRSSAVGLAMDIATKFAVENKEDKKVQDDEFQSLLKLMKQKLS